MTIVNYRFLCVECNGVAAETIRRVFISIWGLKYTNSVLLNTYTITVTSNC